MNLDIERKATIFNTILYLCEMARCKMKAFTLEVWCTSPFHLLSSPLFYPEMGWIYELSLKKERSNAVNSIRSHTAYYGLLKNIQFVFNSEAEYSLTVKNSFVAY